MTPELTALALAGLLQVVQYVLMSVPANLELGPGKTTSPRDPERLEKPLIEQVSTGTGRLFRALDNHFEGLILFTLAVVVVELSETGTRFTALCAWSYLAARVLYVPAYYFGWRPWRSLIWLVGFFATTLMLLSAITLELAL
ncbi:MAPEG family protein [Histidinibacterium aquaticum]|uniref:MAPEG family protein n=1 Tax=Histidinibacterium aquaticum TaxID=2613962 RepID=A0A5J5GBR0_9RHOB|nr:MAPEG family protein [Histidinibacterium aquaticum]KAA9005242.1 MAPEG family protein [Histidinibacterium aquaticum]